MEFVILRDLMLVFGLSILVLLIAHHIRVPSIVGFFLTGFLAGPSGLGLLGDTHEVHLLAEIGVVLLLFSIGVEFSFKSLWRIRRTVLLGGAAQVLLTALAGAALAVAFGHPLNLSVFIGFLLALSSTAITLRVLQSRAEMEAPYGQTTLGILIFQDLAIVPLILLTPLLAGHDGATGQASLALVLRSAAIIFVVIAAAWWGVPRLLHAAAHTRSQELFVLTIVVICFAVAWVTAQAGLSLGLGAFLAGLIISESQFGHHVLGRILPLRSIFTSLFFISVGMLLDLRVLLDHLLFLLALSAAVLLLKALIAAAVALMLRLPRRVAIQSGLALCQVGEFSFVLAKAGLGVDLLPLPIYQKFLAVSVLTMALTPWLIALAPRLAQTLDRLSGRTPQTPQPDVPTPVAESSRSHLVIAGFGVGGRHLSRAAQHGGVTYTVIEMNPETVRTERLRGEPIIFGDASQEPILERAHIGSAGILAVIVSDRAAILRIVQTARQLNPGLHIIVRTRFTSDAEALLAAGANEVVSEEIESSIQIFRRVLRHLLVPDAEAEQLLGDIRAESYDILRGATDVSAIMDLKGALPDYELQTLRLDETAPGIGRSLADLSLPGHYGVAVLAIRRADRILAPPPGDFQLAENDILVLFGNGADLKRSIQLING